MGKKNPSLDNRYLCFAKYDKPDKRAIAVDIETHGLGGKFIYGAYQKEGESTITPFYSEAELWEAMQYRGNRGCIWYAHNGGEYDYRYVIPHIRDYIKSQRSAKGRIIDSGGKVIGLTIRTANRHSIELRDSYRLLPQSLAKLAATLAPELPKLDIGLKKGEIFNVDNPDHIRYATRDVEALLAIILAVRKLIRDTYGVQVGWTAASTAMRAFRHQMEPLERYWRLSREQEDWVRPFYHGGMVLLTNGNKVTNATCVDANSMYPYAMKQGVPYGSPIRVFSYLPGRPGFYKCVAETPQDYRLPYLPCTDSGHLLWPRGRFQSYITSDEVSFALSHGIRIEIIEGYVFPRLVHPFNRFVDKCETLRAQFKGTGMEVVAKLMQNSVYGKFGTKPIHTSYELALEEDKPLRISDLRMVGNLHIIPNDPYCDPRTGDLVPDIHSNEEVIDAAYMHIHWAAWITAQARLHLMKAAYAIGPENVYYCDTDSITADTASLNRAIETGALEIGPRYGQFKVEHIYEWFRAGAPKFYVGKETSGDYVMRAKGIPSDCLNVDDMLRAMDGETVTVYFDSMSSTLNELINNEVRVRRAKRSYSKLDNSIGWEKLASGIILPRLMTYGTLRDEVLS